MAKTPKPPAFKTITVGIASDAIEKISKVQPDSAIEELIWNAIDAEATRIEVVFYENALKGIDRIVVSDNGHGISEKDAENIFGNIGGSPKRLRRRSPNLDRPYHGKEGQGRYKAFSLGRKVAWHSRTPTNGTVHSFSVLLDSSNLKSAQIGKPTNCDGATGCDVNISDMRDGVLSLRNSARLEFLVCRLAPYLIGNPGISISYDGELLDVKNSLSRDETIPVDVHLKATDGAVSFNLRVLEWTTNRKPSLFLCDEHGVALDEIPVRDQLDRQAHRIVEGHKAGDRAVVTHITCWHPKLVCRSADDIMNGDFTLDDARQTIAREYGFADWSDVEARGNAPPDPAFELAVDSLLRGDVEKLCDLLAGDPSLIHRRSSFGHRSTLLHYVGSNGIETYRQRVPMNLAEITRLLVEAGADVNATADMYGGGSTALGLLVTSDHPGKAGVTDDVRNVLEAAGAKRE